MMLLKRLSSKDCLRYQAGRTFFAATPPHPNSREPFMPPAFRRRLLVPVCAIGALWCSSLHAQAPATGQPPLRSAVFPVDSVRVRQGAAANQRSIVDTLTANLSKLEMHETTLAPGQTPHAAHRHGHEELMIVRNGTIEVLQGTVTRLARPGDVVFMASNELHGLKNVGSTSATYLVIRIDPHDTPPDAKPATAPAGVPGASRPAH